MVATIRKFIAFQASLVILTRRSDLMAAVTSEIPDWKQYAISVKISSKISNGLVSNDIFIHAVDKVQPF